MGIIRNALRKLLDHEVGVIGGELERLKDHHQDLQTQLLAFDERYERLRARVGMRVTRAQRLDPVDPREEFMRLAQRNPRTFEPLEEEGGDWVDFRRFQ